VRKKKKNTFFIIQRFLVNFQSFDIHFALEGLDIHFGKSEKLNRHHSQILQIPFGNRTNLSFRLLMTKSDMKILEGYLSMFQVEVVHDVSQPSSHPEGRIFWKKIDDEAETSQQ
jgi:hypothetical protein